MRQEELESRIEANFLSLGANKLEETWSAIHSEKAQEDKDLQVIQMDNRIKYRFQNYSANLVAAAVIFILCMAMLGTGNLYRFRHFYRMSMDVNPGIAFELDKNMRIREAVGTNEDGIRVLSETDIVGCTMDEAFDRLVKTMKDDSYLKDDGMIYISYQARKEKMQNTFETEIESDIQKNLEKNGLYNVALVCKATALQKNQSGKDLLIDDLVKSGKISYDEAKKMSVRELVTSADDDKELKKTTINERKTDKKPSASQEPAVAPAQNWPVYVEPVDPKKEKKKPQTSVLDYEEDSQGAGDGTNPDENSTQIENGDGQELEMPAETDMDTTESDEGGEGDADSNRSEQKGAGNTHEGETTSDTNTPSEGSQQTESETHSDPAQPTEPAAPSDAGTDNTGDAVMPEEISPENQTEMVESF